MASARASLTAARDEGVTLKDEVAKLQRELEAARKKLAAVPPPAKAEPPKPKARKGLLGDIDLDEGPDAPPIKDQLASALRASSGRVMDLLREWDADGDGEISRKEFHAAMPKLGLEVSKSAIDTLFNEWDSDGGGSLEFKELQKILRAAPASPPPKGAKSAKK